MRTWSLRLALIAVAGLFAIPLPAQAGPITCPATGAVCIDESVEGATPTITTPSGFSSTVTPVAVPVGEEWTITVSGTAENSITFPSNPFVPFGLLEPNSQSLSDVLSLTQISVNSDTHLVEFTYSLFSDNELGQIGTTCPGTTCTLLTEDGTFQQVSNLQFSLDNGPPTNVFLRSDVEVPEPASLALLGTALVGFGVIRRRRRLRS